MADGERLAAFEKMYRNIRERYADTERKMEALKAQGKSKSATFRQLMGEKLTLKNMLSMYELYGL